MKKAFFLWVFLLATLLLAFTAGGPQYVVIYQNNYSNWSVWDAEAGKSMTFSSQDEAMNYMAAKGFRFKQAVYMSSQNMLEIIMEK